MTYSLDFRKKVLLIRDKEGASFAWLSKRFVISVNSLFLWSKKLEPKRTKNRPAIKIDREALIKDITKYPDAYNYERALRFQVRPLGIRCAIKRLGISYKKICNHPKASEKRRELFIEKRANYEVSRRAIKALLQAEHKKVMNFLNVRYG